MKVTQQRVYQQQVRQARMVLAFLEGELRKWRDDAEISATTIVTASEYHKGRARGFFEALDLVEKLDVAARRLLRSRGGPQ